MCWQKGFNPLGLFNDPGEGHAFLIGFFEVTCPWPAVRPICKESDEEIEGEYHYYRAGRFFGAVVLASILFGIACLVRDVFFTPDCMTCP